MKLRKTGPKSISVNGNKVEFDQRVDEVVELEDCVIVNLLIDDFPEDRSFDGRNVVCVGEDGKTRWKIEDSGVNVKVSFGPTIRVGYYDLWRPEGDDTIKVGGIDWTYDLDPETGHISNPTHDRDTR